MTTHIVILRPVPVMHLFRHGRALLGAHDGITWEDSDSYHSGGVRRVHNHIGQGLPGIWEVEYRPDGPLRPEAHECEYDEATGRDRCAPEGKSFCDRSTGPACAIEASIDTAYGYTADNGAERGDLHAWFVTDIAAWCRERGAHVRWYAGEVASGYEPVSRIDILGDVEVGRIGSDVPRRDGVRQHEAFGALVRGLVEGGVA